MATTTTTKRKSSYPSRALVRILFWLPLWSFVWFDSHFICCWMGIVKIEIEFEERKSHHEYVCANMQIVGLCKKLFGSDHKQKHSNVFMFPCFNITMSINTFRWGFYRLRFSTSYSCTQLFRTTRHYTIIVIILILCYFTNMHLDGPFCELNDFERMETFKKSDKKTYLRREK